MRSSCASVVILGSSCNDHLTADFLLSVPMNEFEKQSRFGENVDRGLEYGGLVFWFTVYSMHLLLELRCWVCRLKWAESECPPTMISSEPESERKFVYIREYLNRVIYRFCMWHSATDQQYLRSYKVVEISCKLSTSFFYGAMLQLYDSNCSG